MLLLLSIANMKTRQKTCAFRDGIKEATIDILAKNYRIIQIH